MNGISVLDRPQSHDGDATVRTVSGLSMVGRLADDVLADVYKSEAGISTLADSGALQVAIEIFTQAAQAIEEPITLWTRSDVSDALRRMASGPLSGESASVSDDSLSAWAIRLRKVASALGALLEGRASGEDRDFAVAELERISQGTLNAARSSIHTQAYSSSWLTT